MTKSSQIKWDKIYAEQSQRATAQAAPVLHCYQHWLPQEGRALDYACGRGGNALLFAAAGLETYAWDISKVALSQLRSEASASALELHTCTCDLDSQPLQTTSFDVIACSYYLDRARMPEIVAALRPNGLLFYETFNASVPVGKGPRNPDYLLGQAELLQRFASLQVLFYQELWAVHDSEGDTGVSRLVARAPGCD